MRDIYDTMWGKYNSRLAHFVDANFERYDNGVDYATDGDGEGALLIGKRVLWWDNRGFVELEKYENEDKARQVFESYDKACAL